MKTISELLKLQQPVAEATGAPVEIAEVVKNFPNTKRKAVIALLGAGRLTWRGKEIMEIYPDLDEKAQEFIKAEIKSQVYVDVDTGDGMFHVDYEADIDDMQEVYLGYDDKTDTLIIGYDAWLNTDEEFNKEFDEAFERETGEEHDLDSPEHREIYNSAWRKFNDSKAGFVGVAVRIDMSGGELIIEELGLSPAENGFYRGLYKQIQRTMVSVDIRLD